MQCLKCFEKEHQKNSFYCHNCGKKLDLYEINKKYGYNLQSTKDLYNTLTDLTELLYYPHELSIIKKDITYLGEDYLIINLEIYDLEKPNIFLDKNSVSLDNILRSRWNIKDNILHCTVRFNIKNNQFTLDSYTFNRILTINYFETFFFPDDAFSIITYKKYNILKDILPEHKDKYLELPLDLDKSYFSNIHRNFSSLGFEIKKDNSLYEQMFSNKSNKIVIQNLIKLFELDKKYKITKDSF